MLDLRFSQKAFCYFAFLFFWFIVWESHSLFLIIAYFCFCFSLFGEEDEEEPHDPSIELDEIIFNIQSYTSHYVQVIQDPEFLEFYSNIVSPNTLHKSEGGMPLDVDIYNLYELDLYTMQDFLERKELGPFISPDYNVYLFLNFILKQNKLINNLGLLSSFLFLDQNVYSIYSWKKLKKETKNLYFLKNKLNIGLHYDNFFGYFLFQDIDFFDAYIVKKKIQKKYIFNNVKLLNNLFFLKKELLSIFTFPEIFSHNAQTYYDFFFFRNIKLKKETKKICYSYNPFVSFFNLHFVKLPWQK